MEGLEDFLVRRIDKAYPLYKHAPVVVSVGALPDPLALDYAALKAAFAAHGLTVLGLGGVLDDRVAEALKERGIRVINSSRHNRLRQEQTIPQVVTQTFEVQVPVRITERVEVKVPYAVPTREPMLLLKRNVRSGETVTAAGNSVLIWGTVANGARIVASQHVLIFGDLNGQVFAGNPASTEDPGYTQALIYARGRFNPTIVAIAGHYQTADDRDADVLGGPARDHGIIVTLEGDTLVYRPHDADASPA